MIGTKLAHYEITSHLGTGGMGEVYQATDSKLGRRVAIKVLPAAFASDPERLARFRREAQVLASLNHPNIAQIYGLEELGESGEMRCIIMELVEGETLQAQIKRGPIPVNDALAIARRILEALESAHEKGIVHRDLKPGNVMLTGEGQVKVLDFGLARTYEGNSPVSGFSNSPTMLSMAATNAGMILGTAAYMSPEQAKGRSVDQRTDVFAFGCVLYEMLTGKAVFNGEDVPDILSRVLQREPDWTLLPADAPPRLRELLRLCLEKNPKNRRQTAGDVRLDIDQAFRALQEPAVAAASDVEHVEPVKRPLWKRAVPIAAALLIGGAIAGTAFWRLRPVAPLPVTRFPVTLAEGQQFTNTGRMVVAISPDGSQMVYVANGRLYHRAMSELEARPIPGTETWGGVANPVFSPDGRSLVFWALADRTLKKIAVTGGASVTLCPSPNNVFGMSWGADGIVFGQNQGILRVSAIGGNPALLVKTEAGELAGGPQILPGGDAVLYTVGKGQQSDQAQIVVQSLKPGSPRQVIIQAGSAARYVPTGHIVYAFGGTLFAVPFDLARLQVTGGQVPVVEGVQRGGLSAQFSFSSTGSLIYVPGPVNTTASSVQRSLAALSRENGTAGLQLLKVPTKAYAFVRVSPDGKRVAVSTDDINDTNVWIVDLTGAAAPRQLTLGGANRFPVWSPDGEWVAFQSDREGDSGIFRQKADGTTGVAERLTKPEMGMEHIPDSWSPDGKWLAYTLVKGTEWAVWTISLQDKKAAVFAEKAGSRIGRAAFSPDGHWLAYQSNEAEKAAPATGTTGSDIFVQPFPATGAKYLVVNRSGQPMWSPDGREIIFNPAVNRMGFVSITTRPVFSFGEPSIRDTMGFGGGSPNQFPRRWDITPDGKRIIGVVNNDRDSASSSTPTTPAAPQIQVVLNWFEELKQRMAAH